MIRNRQTCSTDFLESTINVLKVRLEHAVSATNVGEPCLLTAGRKIFQCFIVFCVAYPIRATTDTEIGQINLNTVTLKLMFDELRRERAI